MKLLKTYKHTEKKSRFIGYFYEISTKEKLEQLLEEIKKDNKKANHICYATLIQEEQDFKNDGEVGSPGKLLLEILKREQKNNHLLLIIRYFGGVKLGMGGVQRAFRQTGNQCLKE